MAISFRPLVDADLPMLHGWLNDPAVVRWWEGDDVSWAGVVEDYSEATRGPEEHHIAIEDGRPIGWIQSVQLRHDPEEARAWVEAGADPGIIGIDYLIGAATDRHRGLGPAMVEAYVHDVVFPGHPDCPQVGADPYVENHASWKALAKAGFRHLADLPDEEGPCRLMVLDRAD